MSDHGAPGEAERIVDELEAKVLGGTPGARQDDRADEPVDESPAVDQDLDVEQMSAGEEEGGAAASSD